MKKVIILLMTLFLSGCYTMEEYIQMVQMEMIMQEHYSHQSSTRLVKRILYYNDNREIVKEFGGFEELTYLGKVIVAMPRDYYMVIGYRPYKGAEVTRFYMSYENSIIHVDSSSSSRLEDCYLFMKQNKQITNYIFLRKRPRPQLDYIFWKIEELETPAEELIRHI